MFFEVEWSWDTLAICYSIVNGCQFDCEVFIDADVKSMRGKNVIELD